MTEKRALAFLAIGWSIIALFYLATGGSIEIQRYAVTISAIFSVGYFVVRSLERGKP